MSTGKSAVLKVYQGVGEATASCGGQVNPETRLDFQALVQDNHLQAV